MQLFHSQYGLNRQVTDIFLARILPSSLFFIKSFVIILRYFGTILQMTQKAVNR